MKKIPLKKIKLNGRWSYWEYSKPVGSKRWSASPEKAHTYLIHTYCHASAIKIGHLLVCNSCKRKASKKTIEKFLTIYNMRVM